MDRSNRKPPLSPRVADANRIADTIAGSNPDPATGGEAQWIAMPRSIDIATVGRREFLALGAATAAGTIALPALAQGRDFGAGFVWGAATSAYQIEGSATHAGRGTSVWDTFCRRPGAIRDGSSGEVACDHINRWREDLALIRELGVRAYRFSISWPRVLPDGTGGVSAAGLDFYDRLVDALLAAGIEPWVTLFHWDYPEALHKRGGWLKDESPDWFAKYAATVVKRLSDRVRHWMTFNEPEIFIILGYQLALHAPGDKLSWSDILRISHRVLLAHGLATQAMRATSKQPCQIGCAAALQPVMPATDQPADLDAARRATFSGMAAWLLEPMYRGAYPDSELKAWEKDVPKFPVSDLRTIAQPLDVFVEPHEAAAVTAEIVRIFRDHGPREARSQCRLAHLIAEWGIEELARMSPYYMSAYPNAGLPDPLSETGFPETAETLAPKLARWAKNGWLNVVGGCCGTTPDHIRALTKLTQKFSPRAVERNTSST